MSLARVVDFFGPFSPTPKPKCGKLKATLPHEYVIKITHRFIVNHLEMDCEEIFGLSIGYRDSDRWGS
jgi:hypothetical protein